MCENRFLLFVFVADQEKLPIFYGNVSDYFKLLDQDENSLLIGARYANFNKLP